MTNQIAISLFVLILCLFAADALLFQWSMSLFLARQFADLIEWVSFWR